MRILISSLRRLVARLTNDEPSAPQHTGYSQVPLGGQPDALTDVANPFGNSYAFGKLGNVGNLDSYAGTLLMITKSYEGQSDINDCEYYYEYLIKICS